MTARKRIRQPIPVFPAPHRPSVRSILVLAGGMACWHPLSALQAQEPPVPAAPTAGETTARTSVEEVRARDWGDEDQVKVAGGDPRTRVRFSVFIDELRDDFRWLLFKLRIEAPGERSIWTIPVQVTLWGGFQDVHSGDDLLTTVELRPDNRFVIKLEAKLHDRFDEDAFQRELVRALLIEQIVAPYANRPGDFRLEQVQPPEWLVEGFDQLIRHRRGGSPSSFYRGYLESGQFLKPTELFAMGDPERLDPVRRAIFRASASAMVEALLDQPDGDLDLRGLLGDLGQPAPPAMEVLLRQHFPAFREMDQGLEKWWALELVTLGQQQSFEYLDRAETERLLDEALTLRFEATPVAEPVAEKKGLFDFLKPKPATPPSPLEAFVGTLDQFEQYRTRPGVKDQLAGAFDRIQNLKRVGFPLYRPVFAAYESAILRLSRDDTKDLAAEFAAIAAMRQKIGETLVRAEDSLNHFEATRAPVRSNEFDGYFQMRREFEERPRPKRNDPITRALDALEWEFR